MGTSRATKLEERTGSVLRRTARRTAAVLGAIGLVTMTFTAVSSSEAGAASSGKATGSPFLVGYTPEDAGNILVDTGGVASIKAAVGYINNSLDGVDGHPIKLVTCVVDGTPASAAKCADTMVGTKGLHFVFTGLNASSQSADPIFESAGLFFTGIPLTPADEASKGADFINGGSSASQAAVGEFMVKNLHAKKIGIIADDSPVTIAAAEEVQNVGKKYGVSSVIEEPAPDAVDMTGNYEAMATAGVDAIAFLIYPNQVASFVQAARSQGSKIPLVTEDAVVPTSVEAQLGNQVKGIYLGSLAANPLGNTPDAVAFRAAAQKYDGSNWKVALTGEGVSEYQDLMTIYKNALLKIPYNTISGKTIQAALNKPGTATLGPPYQCGLPSPLPAICSFTDIFSLYGGPPTFAEEPIGGTHPVINARALIDSGVVPK